MTDINNDYIANVITEYTVTDDEREGTFNKLLEAAAGFQIAAESDVATGDNPEEARERAATGFEELCYKGECTYLADTGTLLDEIPKYAKGKKAGQYKISNLLNKTYKHAKSTISSAIRDGIELKDEDGDAKGKSRIEKEKREAKAGDDDETVDGLLTAKQLEKIEQKLLAHSIATRGMMESAITSLISTLIDAIPVKDEE